MLQMLKVMEGSAITEGYNVNPVSVKPTCVGVELYSFRSLARIGIPRAWQCRGKTLFSPCLWGGGGGGSILSANPNLSH